MRFVTNQDALLLHRAREPLVRQHTILANAIRADAAEFGLIVPKGIQRLPELRVLIATAEIEVIPSCSGAMLSPSAQTHSEQRPDAGVRSLLGQQPLW